MKTKIWLVVAVCLILIGCIVFGGVMSMLNWDFSKLSTVKYETNQHEIIEEFDRISINTNTADILFALSDDDKCSVECYEEEKAKHSITVRDGTLVIEVTNRKHWFDYIAISFGSPKIKISLPKMEYAALFISSTTGDVEIPENFTFCDVDISLTTGDIHMEELSTDALDLSVSTGKVTVKGAACTGDISINVSTGSVNLSDVTCQNLRSTGSTGDLSMSRVIAAETFFLKRNTGDITFDHCDAADLTVETNTGDIKGSLLTAKIFVAEASTGKIDVPGTATGGSCKVKTNTGNIKITVP